MINTIILNQFFGAGDIIFCQTIANNFVAKGFKVIWPVQDIYAPLAKHFPNITMIDKSLLNIDYTRNEPYEINGSSVIPLRFTDSICKVPYTDCMKSKYWYFDLQWQQWKENCVIKRDFKNELKLFSELGLARGERYNLISEQFTTGGVRTVQIPEPENGLKTIRMKFMNGYTLIDWLFVMQEAEEIFAVSSANIYLFELFLMKAQFINLYIRRPTEQNHDNYSYILTPNKYILHP